MRLILEHRMFRNDERNCDKSYVLGMLSGRDLRMA